MSKSKKIPPRSDLPQVAGQKYLRLIVGSRDRGKLYKKDFEVSFIFGMFVRTMVSDLISQGIMLEGDFYKALLIPRYEDYQLQGPRVEMDPDRIFEMTGWIALAFEGEVRPDSPIRCLTVELQVVETAMIWRQDVSLPELSLMQSPLFKNIAQILQNLSVVRADEALTCELFAREDEFADTERDELFAAGDEDESLVEMVDMESESDPFMDLPEKSADGYLVEETVGKFPAKSENLILISRTAFHQTQEIARRGARVEEGGVLVGQVFRRAGAAGYLIDISDHIFDEDARGTKFELRYTFEAWQKRMEQMKTRAPGLRLVGWYHTHLVRMTYFNDETGRSDKTELFFSQDDVFMHRQFFPDKWYVAMVLNPKGEAVFFNWNGNEILKARGFLIYGSSALPADAAMEQ